MICAHAGASAYAQEACFALHNSMGPRDGSYDSNVEVPDEQPGSSAMAGESSDKLLSGGQQRRVEIMKALGLPWVAV